MHIGIAALIQDFKGKAYEIPTGADGQWAKYLPFTRLIGARFVLFRIRGGLGSLNLCRDYAASVETTFRMALKCGLTMFSCRESELLIRSLHFDGYAHYHRRLDMHTILKGLGNPPYRVRLHTEIELNDNTSDHQKPSAQPYDDCQLLQLTDILVSGFRAILTEGTAEAQWQVSRPLSELMEKWNRGRKGFSNSRWSNGFCVREGRIENGQWEFSSVEPDFEAPQAELFEKTSPDSRAVHRP